MDTNEQPEQRQLPNLGEITMHVRVTDLKEFHEAIDTVTAALKEIHDEIQHLRNHAGGTDDVLHRLGNSISGKIGTREVEIIVRQIVEDVLKANGVISG